ncbi:MAG: HD domain-containing protein [Actinobacteria bacterium]|nr:HD domain-containing protein [Actinomycetota bacterium]
MGPGSQAAVDAISVLFESEGAADYLGEPVTQAAHMLQAAALASRAGAPPEQIAAALLHDVGHLTGADAGGGRELMQGTDDRHGDHGASWLSQWFGPELTEPVRLHVEAKRYLCAAEPGYLNRLSPASVLSLGVQGGPMRPGEIAEFEASPYARAACQLRRWDDQAKDPAAMVPPIQHYASLLAALAR